MSRRKLYWIIVIIIFISLVTLGFWPKKTPPLKLFMLNVGQGDAIYIETPGGTNFLIDSGRDRTVLHELGKVINKGKIDIIEVSNPDLDHIGGFPFVMEKYEIGRILSPGTNHETLEAFNKIEALAKSKKIPIERPKEGTKYILDKKYDVIYTVLWPEGNVRSWETNPGSIIGLLEYGGKKILLTGDSPKEVEDQVVAQHPEAIQNLDILKVGHHGSKTSTGESLMKIGRPKIAIISAGQNNRYGHPHKEVLNILQKFNVTTLVTSEVGTIECTVYPKVPVSCK